VAGVNYPVGYDSRLTLRDPTVSANLPAGCVVNASSPYRVACAASGSLATITVAGLDFSLHGCVKLILSNNDASLTSITLKNDKFVSGPNCSFTNGALIAAYGGSNTNYTLTVENSVLDGCATTDQFCAKAYSAQPVNLINDGHRGGAVYKYNVILGSTGRPITWNGQAGGPDTFYYNYTTGWVYPIAANAQHGRSPCSITSSTPVSCRPIRPWPTPRALIGHPGKPPASPSPE
jgi:hypothetical protein